MLNVKNKFTDCTYSDKKKKKKRFEKSKSIDCEIFFFCSSFVI
jgi:hypothetical protein